MPGEIPRIPSTALSQGLVQRVVSALAETTGATALLIDPAGAVAAGPVSAHPLARLLLTTPQGRATLLGSAGEWQTADALPLPGLSSLTAPVSTSGGCAGVLRLLIGPEAALSADQLAQLAQAARLPADAVRAIRPQRSLDPDQAGPLLQVMAELLAEVCTQEKHLRDRLDELSAVYSIAGMLVGTRDLQEILSATARTVCEVMKVKACSIRMLDEITGALTIKAVYNLSDAYIRKGPVMLEENPIDRAALGGELVRIADAPNDPRTRYPEQAREEGIVSGLVCGLIYRGKAVGVLRVYTGEPHVFSSFEEALLKAVATQSAAAIVNARLLADTLEAERYARQIAYAGHVQRRMIPAHPPACAALDLGAIYRPTYNVGGDFYDFICLPKDNLGIAIADVSGKGVPASLLMASIRSALRVYAYFTYDVDRIVCDVNKHLCRETTTGEFATLFYGVVTPDATRLTYCNAGHDPPMLLRNRRITPLDTGGMLVGVDPEAGFERGVVALQPGDAVLLYTDGVVEAMNFADERFGTERLIESLTRHVAAGADAQHIAQNILWDLRRFRGLADRTDDVTMVVLKVR